MKTKKVRAVLVESKNNKDRQYPCILKYSHIFGDIKGKIGYYDCNIRTPTIKMEIILINLEDEIKEEDKYLTEDGEILQTYNTTHKKCNCRKVIATQDQISPEYISKFIEQYNSNCVEDIEIEMEEFLEMNNLTGECIITYESKMTNGFITIIEKDPDYEGFVLEINEYERQGLPVDRKLLIKLANKYNTPIPNYGDIPSNSQENIMYTEEEVLEIIDKYDTAKWGCPSKKSIDEITKWFELNKKK